MLCSNPRRLLPLLLVLAAPLGLTAQAPPDAWRLDLTRGWYRLDRVNGEGAGFGLALRPRLTPVMRLDFGVDWMTSSDGDYSMTGGAVNLGLMLGHRWPRFSAEGGGGLRGMAVNGDDGEDGGGVLPYVAAQAGLWPIPTVGLIGRFELHAKRRELSSSRLSIGVALAW